MSWHAASPAADSPWSRAVGETGFAAPAPLKKDAVMPNISEIRGKLYADQACAVAVHTKCRKQLSSNPTDSDNAVCRYH